MKVIIFCEESQEICKAFRERGHEAYSCDIQLSSGGRPEWHFQADARIHLGRVDWDLFIAHPPCTFLAISGNRWFKNNPDRYRGRLAAIDFFFRFVFHDCPKTCIEQPKGIMSSVYRKPDQIIQPWQFGHGEKKETHLWLKGLPPLIPTDVVTGRQERVFRNIGPGPDRQKIRSKTYPGIAKAMAEQWG